MCNCGSSSTPPVIPHVAGGTAVWVDVRYLGSRAIELTGLVSHRWYQFVPGSWGKVDARDLGAVLESSLDGALLFERM